MIDAKRIHEMVLSVLWTDEETQTHTTQQLAEKSAKGYGVTINVGLHPERLQALRPEIIGFLKQLHPDFMQSGEQGATFLMMVADSTGDTWGEQMNAQELLMLATASGLAEFPLPREAWPGLPGGVPYVLIRDDLFEQEQA